MPKHELIPQAGLHETKGGTLVLNGYSVFGATFDDAIVNLASGDNVIYTVPTGKRLIRMGRTLRNNSGSSANLIAKHALSGSITVAQPSFSIANGALQSENPAGVLGDILILEATEQLVINSDQASVYEIGGAYLFSATSGLSSKKLSTFIVGNNTLYTCPADKRASVMDYRVDAVYTPTNPIANFFFYNNSGSTVNYELHVVKFGGSVGAANLVESFALTNGSVKHVSAGGVTLAGGDFISIVSDSSTSGQFASTNIGEVLP